MAIDSQTLDRMFRFYPNTADQEDDLKAVYRDARQLAETIQRCVDSKYADQQIGQLAAIVSQCRTAIELSPRQLKPVVLV